MDAKLQSYQQKTAFDLFCPTGPFCPDPPYQLSAMTDFQSQKATVKCNNQHKINKFRPSSDSPSIPAAFSQPGDERFGVHRANPAFSPVELVFHLQASQGADAS